MESAIIIKNLKVSSKDKVILKGINVEIPKNKLTVLLGPSGCGKTTLFKCLNRLTDLYPELKVEGSVFIGEDDIFHTKQNVTDLRQKMGLLNQKPYPLPMSIFKNVAYGLKLKGVKDKKILAEKVEVYLKQAALWDEVKDRLNDSATRLSIGQQQRLCLARGLATNPEILLADEPTSALDPISSKAIEEKFLELKENYTVIVVTHILRQAKRLADHVIFMYDGQVIEQGSPKELFENPQTETLKKYIQVGY
ncbi:MAG: phosphate ABC transporter ATP-binding protein [Bacteroidetes bacterium HGW-Bacteroidetes-3]|jgi:phosphate transport system ATP-binding protein|nr:MAG: phosphate ABC transporter ATP-binding protein [Bacteroidetes bacterium HGW-Bacteroidetes-3]